MFTIPQMMLLSETDKDIRNAQRSAAGGDPIAAGRAEHAEWRAGKGHYAGLPMPPQEYKELLSYLKDMDKKFPEEKEQEATTILPEILVYYSDLEDAFDAWGDALEKWLETPHNERKSPRPAWGAFSRKARQLFAKDHSAQSSWRRQQWRQGNYALYNPDLRPEPLTTKQIKAIETFHKRPWFIKDWAETYSKAKAKNQPFVDNFRKEMQALRKRK